MFGFPKSFVISNSDSVDNKHGIAMMGLKQMTIRYLQPPRTLEFVFHIRGSFREN